MPQGSQTFNREKTPVGQSGVESRRSVALGEDKAVPINLF